MTRAHDKRLLPAPIADARGNALLSLTAAIGASFDWRAGLALTEADIPADFLPFAVRSFGLQSYVQPGMDERFVRALIANRVKIKADEGLVSGVKFALGLIGFKVSWKQWFQQSPMGAPGTHVVTAFVNDTIFPDQTTRIDDRVINLARTAILNTKRHSQDIDFRIGVATAGAAGVAAAAQGLAVVQATGSASMQVEVGRTMGAAVGASALQVVQGAAEVSPPLDGGLALGAAVAAQALAIVRLTATARVS